jgi:hypothetical protein
MLTVVVLGFMFKDKLAQPIINWLLGILFLLTLPVLVVMGYFVDKKLVGDKP